MKTTETQPLKQELESLTQEIAKINLNIKTNKEKNVRAVKNLRRRVAVIQTILHRPVSQKETP